MQIILKNVRLSYPNLFQKKSYQGSEAKYSATLILDKEVNAADIKKVESAINSMVKEHFKGNPKALKGTCYRDGAEKVDEDGNPKDGYGEGVMFVSASNKNRPQVVTRGREQITEEDGIIYGGCYVNAVVSLWAQNNDFGKRINANLKAIQFVRDFEPFGEAKINVDEVFDEIEDEDDMLG